MAAKQTYPIQGAFNPGVKFLAGRFTVDASDNCTITAGRGFTVARTGAGEYTVTFAKAYKSALSANVNLVRNDDDPTYIVTVASFSTTTVVFKTWVIDTASAASATATDLPDTEGLTFLIVLQETSLSAT